MKTLSILALTTLGFAASAPAAVLVGFYDFAASTSNEAQDVAAANFTATVTKTTDSRDAGGSDDGFYGNSTIPLTTLAGGDGYLRVSNGTLVMTVTYSASASLPVQLDTLYFDASHITGGTGAHTLSYLINTGTSVSLGGFNTTETPASDTVAQSYDDFGIAIPSVTLNPGDKISFTFSSASLRLDNIALTGNPIPEPAQSLLALSGAFMLLRRRRF